MAGIITSLRHYSSDVKITALSNNPEETRELHGIDAVERGVFPRAAADADLFICGGGSLFQDATSARSVIYYLGQFWYCSRIAKTKSAVYAQGIGPLSRRWVRILTAKILDNASLITLRDFESAQLLQQIGVREPRIEVTADPAFALPRIGREAGKHYLRERGIGSAPLIAICPRRWRGFDGNESVITAVSTFTSEIGAAALFIPMFPLQDSGLTSKMAAGCPAFVDGGLLNDYRGIRKAIAGSDLLISTRLHGLIFAVREGIPAIGISYDPKVESFCKMCGIPYLEITDFSSQELLNLMRQVWNERDSISASEYAISCELVNRAICNAQMVLDLI